ncbi:MAG TPA: hypothetical protein VMU32_07850 [Solirubrobacteraceae bacterium]|nr:hypothetical protein [Solirubrobacteraceae bacterium]
MSIPALLRAFALATATAASLGCAAGAQADLFGPISLMSAGTIGAARPQQAEYAHDAAISGDGRYTAFDGSVGGVTGVWRRNVASGAIEEVAGGDAELPSLSETGRYISFTSSEDLVPADEARGVNVWVRDMEPGPGEPEYILASAVNGSEKGLAYAYAEHGGEESKLGSVATGRSAISASGQEVAFVTTAVSNLVRYPKLEEEEEGRGETPKPHTPALQVAVRYLQSKTTRLVSGTYREGHTSEEPVANGAPGERLGAVYPGASRDLGFGPVPADGYWANDPPPGAAISADGSTVAWMGEDIAQQAPMLPGETPAPLYTEPLWRRIAPGSETSTERVTGGSDPANPACVASGEQRLPEVTAQSAADPCQGPFKVGLATLYESRGIWSETGGGGDGDFVPRLSGDGERVAFLATAVPTVLGLGFGNEFEGEPADLYVAEMRPGLTRDQALTPLTEIGGKNTAAGSAITDFAISANGEQVAFTTRRSQFALGSPALISAPLAEPGESELFDADLHDDTVTRVTHGYAGEPSEQAHESVLDCPEAEDPYCNPITIGAQSPALSADGDELAFASTASNLVYGDGNAPRNPFGQPEGELDGSDAFLVARQPPLTLPTPETISAPPGTPLDASWALSATALSRSNGSVLLYVAVPGPGILRADASGSVLLGASAATAAHRRAGRRHPRGREANGGRRAAAARARPAGAAHRRAQRASAALTVGTAGEIVPPGGAQIVQLVLTLAKPYAKLAGRRDGLSANVELIFAAPHHPTLRQALPVTFLRIARARHVAAGRGARHDRGDRR